MLGYLNCLQESTIGEAFFSQTLAVNDEKMKLEIWERAGEVSQFEIIQRRVSNRYVTELLKHQSKIVFLIFLGCTSFILFLHY
jgi:hypothetical protein